MTKLEICESHSLAKQRLKARSREKVKEANREKKIYIKTNKHTNKTKKQRKKKKVKKWDVARLGETSLYHYTTKDEYVSERKSVTLLSVSKLCDNPHRPFLSLFCLL